MSLRGNCRTLSDRIDWRPAIRMTRLTTSASTGRRMNRSVHFISAVLRLRRRIAAGLGLIVHEHRRSVAQLEHARGDDLLAGLHAREDRDQIAARIADLHE